MNEETIKSKLTELAQQQQQSLKDVMTLEKNLEGAKAELNVVNGQISAFSEVLSELQKTEESEDAET